MVRKYRELTKEHKQKISNALKGKQFTPEHKEALSLSMKRYWQTVPNQPKEEMEGEE